MTEEELRAEVARVTNLLTEAEAVIVLAQDELSTDHKTWWTLDSYDGSMEAINDLKEERDQARKERDEMIEKVAHFREEIQKVVEEQASRVEELVALAADKSARTVLDDLQKRNVLMTTQIIAVLRAAQNLVTVYRQEGLGWKPRTETMMVHLVTAVDDL